MHSTSSPTSQSTAFDEMKMLFRIKAHKNKATRMIRSELILKLIYKHCHMQPDDVDMAVKVILDALSGTLAKGGRVEIRDFGSFKLNYKPPRKGRNPKTGENVYVRAKHVPHFKVGKELKERIIARGNEYLLG